MKILLMEEIFVLPWMQIYSLKLGILAKTVDEHDANSGSMVVIDPESFEILAMSNYPSFDQMMKKLRLELLKIKPLPICLSQDQQLSQ